MRAPWCWDDPPQPPHGSESLRPRNVGRCRKGDPVGSRRTHWLLIQPLRAQGSLRKFNSREPWALRRGPSVRPHSPAWATPCRVWSLRTHEQVYGATCPAGRSERWWAHFQGVCFGDSLRPAEVSPRNGLGCGQGRAGRGGGLPLVSRWQSMPICRTPLSGLHGAPNTAGQCGQLPSDVTSSAF